MSVLPRPDRTEFDMNDHPGGEGGNRVSATPSALLAASLTLSAVLVAFVMVVLYS
ncbi:hypothetical protein AB0M20_31390 [Actinoplanes sp. NPDC051633]|uniref:hypothetical protein n=1 Tax=Actinoplanes sp. NPDC051633 TaxID=3155670 RepID=UPI00343A7165